MGDQIHAGRSTAAWRRARAQHGVLTRDDLLGLGFTPKSIKHRLATGRLHPISYGIYVVGRPELTPNGRWMAAVLACGDGAVLTHRSAAELWGIGREWEGRIDVTIRRRSVIRRRGIKVRSRPALPSQNLVRRHGIPVTDPVQTLIDLAAELKVMRLERAVNEADVLDLVDPETLRAALDGYVGMPGVRTPAQQARAVRRDQTHTAAGLRVLRFTHWQIAHEPNEVTHILRTIRLHLTAT
jgi:hypothetical protein